MSSCSLKRKLEENDVNGTSDDNTSSPRKKIKLDSDAKQNDDDVVDDNTFDVKLGTDKIINLFASFAMNSNGKNDLDKNNKLMSLKIGCTDWKFEFFEMPTDRNNDIYKFLDGLFCDKLCDWKEYIEKNNFIAVIKDNFGIWRGAILFIIYELQLKQRNDLKYLIKIPLAGVDLHFRRQNVGSILVNYMVSIIHEIMENKNDKYQIIVLVIDENPAKSFWRKNSFIPAINHKKIDYHYCFNKTLMEKKGFIRKIENELIIMIYIGDKTTDLVLNNQSINSFKTPKYVNFNQRYCKKDEIEQTEKAHKEWERKKKEIEEKEKKKQQNNDEEEEEEESDDEDFDFEQAKQQQSSDDYDSDEEEEEDDDIHQ